MELEELYFEWMSELAFPSIYDRRRYSRLLEILNSSIFHFSIPMDENRMTDGIDLRYRFGYEKGYSNQQMDIALRHNRSCSMLEMMVALALRGDEHIAYDYETGGKTDYIFNTMLESLRLKSETNERIDIRYVESRIDALLNHDYDYDGNGGLFTVENPRQDMRHVDIWYQMNWFLQRLFNN